MNQEIYLDGNATSAVLPAAVAAAVRAMQDCYGNPSSTHSTGLVAKALLDDARARARRLLGVGDGRFMFNSGATEGIQTAVLSALCAVRARRTAGEAAGTLLVYGATEHKAVPEALAHWNRLLGLDLVLTVLPVDGSGRHDLGALRALAPHAALVCTMAANNETGVVSDLDGIAAVLADTGSSAYWLVDCVQALGKLALNLSATRIDYAPFSGHKLYAPKGIGMLYVRAGAPFTPLIMGGGQETGLRSGTENMAGIAALGAVLAALEQGGTFRSIAELTAYRDRLADSLRAALPGVVFNTPFAHALPTTLNFSVPGLSSRELMDVFDAAGVRVSSGSACSASKAAPSYVLEAMAVPAWRSGSAIRLSFGPLADGAVIAAACERIARCGAALRASCMIADPAADDRQPDGLTDGVLQLGSGAACSWIVFDAASRACAVIDPQPELAARIATVIGCQGYRLQALLYTQCDTVHGQAVARAPLPEFGNAGVSDGDALRTAFTLDDGQDAPALLLGAQALLRVPCGPGQVGYLLGCPDGARLPAAAVRYAFTGHAVAPAPLLARVVHPDTLLCAARDEAQPFCSSVRAESGHAALADDDMHLTAAQLRALLAARPDAVLVDVREAYEHAACADGGMAGHPVLSVPLGQLTHHIAGWLHGAPVPLVFYCRSGNRSSKAAQCLRRLGYRSAYHLAGGMALAA